MKIVELHIENFKRVRTATIRPDSHMVQVTGANASGKTSTLDAIITALGGKRMTPGMPVHHGAEVARIRLDLGDIVVKWHCRTDGKPSLVVESVEGARYPSPQTLLDKLYGSLTFDPLEFSRMTPAEQRQEIASLAGLTGSLRQYDEQDAADYTERTIVNRQAKQMSAQLSALPEMPPIEAENMQELLDALREAQTANRQTERVAAMAAECAVLAAERRDAATRMRRAADKAMLDADNADAMAIDYERQGASIEVPAMLDTSAIEDRIGRAEVVNTQWRTQESRKELVVSVERLESLSNEITERMQNRGTERAGAIASAPLPIKGLGFVGGGVTYNGVPFDQASSAERIRVSCAIARALNPQLRVLLIKDGSLLDSTMLKAMTDDPEMADYQVWMERVDETGKVGVYLTDGEVSAVHGVPVTAGVSGNE
jgi:hypothetical protein